MAAELDALATQGPDLGRHPEGDVLVDRRDRRPQVRGDGLGLAGVEHEPLEQRLRAAAREGQPPGLGPQHQGDELPEVVLAANRDQVRELRAGTDVRRAVDRERAAQVGHHAHRGRVLRGRGRGDHRGGHRRRRRRAGCGRGCRRRGRGLGGGRGLDGRGLGDALGGRNDPPSAVDVLRVGGVAGDLVPPGAVAVLVALAVPRDRLAGERKGHEADEAEADHHVDEDVVAGVRHGHGVHRSFQ